MTSSWISDAKRTPILPTAEALGLVTNAPYFNTCPFPQCGRSRALVGGKLPKHGGSGCIAYDDHWTCLACGHGGDVIDLVALTLFQRRLRDCDASQTQRVREWFGGASTGTRPSATPTATKAATPTPTAPRYPDRSQLKRLWTSCVRVDEDDGAAAYLRGRGVDPTDPADRNLARVITKDTYLPPWARSPEGTWLASDHRLIALLCDAHGEPRSALARRVTAITNDTLKSCAPAGHERRELVMACSMARRVLRYAAHPSQWPVDVDDANAPFGLSEPWWPADRPLDLMIAEGEVDWITAVTEWSDAAEFAPAVIGLVQGSWSQAIADRIPDHTRVWIGTDHDDAGNKYAERIRATFVGRVIDVTRVEVPQ